MKERISKLEKVWVGTLGLFLVILADSSSASAEKWDPSRDLAVDKELAGLEMGAGREAVGVNPETPGSSHLGPSDAGANATASAVQPSTPIETVTSPETISPPVETETGTGTPETTETSRDTGTPVEETPNVIEAEVDAGTETEVPAETTEESSNIIDAEVGAGAAGDATLDAETNVGGTTTDVETEVTTDTGTPIEETPEIGMDVAGGETLVEAETTGTVTGDLSAPVGSDLVPIGIVDEQTDVGAEIDASGGTEAQEAEAGVEANVDGSVSGDDIGDDPADGLSTTTVPSI